MRAPDVPVTHRDEPVDTLSTFDDTGVPVSLPCWKTFNVAPAVLGEMNNGWRVPLRATALDVGDESDGKMMTA